jgi:hypothetical protein
MGEANTLQAGSKPMLPAAFLFFKLQQEVEFNGANNFQNSFSGGGLMPNKRMYIVVCPR